MGKRISKFSYYLFFILVFVFLAIGIQKNNAVVIVVPPGLVFESEPELILIPHTYVYYVSKDDNDLFFYDGYWWRPWHDNWYRSDIYSGPWDMIDPDDVPAAVVDLPPHWRGFPSDVIVLDWGDVWGHWRDWKYDGYWEHHGWRGYHHRDFHHRNYYHDHRNYHRDFHGRGHYDSRRHR